MTLPPFDPSSWASLTMPAKLAALEQGRCLASQARRNPCDANDLAWGTAHSGLASPLLALAAAGDAAGAIEAIALGACPFARCPKAFSNAFALCFEILGAERDPTHNDLSEGQLAMGPAGARALLAAAWAAGAPLLDPSSQSFLGVGESRAILAWLGLACVSSGCRHDAHQAGIPFAPFWLDPLREDRSPWLGPFLVQWCRGPELRAFLEAGFDLASPAPSDPGSPDSPSSSLWLYLHDELPDPLARAAVLLDAGNDPLLPGPAGVSALREMELSGVAEELLPGLRALLLSRREAAELAELFPASHPIHAKSL